jgi:hypothetical protein
MSILRMLTTVGVYLRMANVSQAVPTEDSNPGRQRSNTSLKPLGYIPVPELIYIPCYYFRYLCSGLRKINKIATLGKSYEPRSKRYPVQSSPWPFAGVVKLLIPTIFSHAIEKPPNLRFDSNYHCFKCPQWEIKILNQHCFECLKKQSTLRTRSSTIRCPPRNHTTCTWLHD